jgi:hypothetical protein
MDTKADLAPLRISDSRSAQDRRRIKGRRRDQYVHYSHEMNGDTAESSARTLIRAVPLVYGALLGGLVGSIPLGLSFGLLMSLAFDLRMGNKSISRPVLRPVFRVVCPILSPLLRGLITGFDRVRLPVPADLRNHRCESR